ncbi:MAG: LamG-like jellyroll fold domain-containing protein [Bacteroidota bacterium]|nr:LamG-like jellyroll fold domain-containing protein [Bacteroidota bacterium]
MKLILLSLSILNFIHLSAQIPSNGLKVFYPFNQNSNDESGNSQHGSKSNVSLAKDRFGKDSSAYYFNGNTNSYIEIPVTNLLNNTYTYSLWAKLKTYPTSGNMSFMLNIGGPGGDQSLNAANNFGSSFNGWLAGGYNTSSPHFSLNENASLVNTWCHVVCVRNSNYVLLYVNGVLSDSIGSSTNKSPYYGSTSKAFIGIRNNLSSPFNGWIDDIAIYDRPLSKTEVLKLYNYQPNTSISNLFIQEKLKLFPNPSTNYNFKINSSLINLSKSNFKIYNTIGQAQNFETTIIDDFNIEFNHHLTNGSYFILVTDEFLNSYKINLIVK